MDLYFFKSKILKFCKCDVIHCDLLNIVLPVIINVKFEE